MKLISKKTVLLLAMFLSVVVGVSPAAAGGAGDWDKDVVKLFGSLPVQDGGRVKPLSTYADFKLLKFNGKRKIVTPSEQKLKSTAWLMDCLFFPEVAETYKCFRVQNDEVLIAIGLELEGKKRRDYYSLAELRPNLDQLMAKAREWSHKEQSQMEPVERQLLALAQNIVEFRNLTHEFDFAKIPFSAGDGPQLPEILGAPSVSLSTVLGKFSEIRGLAMSLGRGEDQSDPDLVATQALLRQLDATLGGARLALIAPEVSLSSETQWRSATDLINSIFTDQESIADSVRLVSLMEDLVHQREDTAAFSETLTGLHAGSATLADERGEYWKIPLEQKFYRMDFFTNALVFFLIGFLLAAFGWLRPKSIWLQRGVWGCVLTGTVLATVGITMRCIIRSRPPVSTLYETILFTGIVCVLIALAMEYMNRKRIALALSAIFGALGMWVSMKYELKEAVSSGDTMPSLVAVLDTNFWLSTHVTTVTMGYSAGLLAALLAHVWLFGKAFGLRKNDSGFYKDIIRMVYGVLCFGLLFSVVGTILGGIWANYSWGRFWGWDPKENGALLICLWELLILHLRMGGFIRDRGLCVLSVWGGIVVVISWWGVNLLGIGLHSYGFTSGVAWIIGGFIAAEVFILLATWFISIGQNRSDEGTGDVKLSSEGLAK